MPKIKNLSPKQTLEVLYSNGILEVCTASYSEITPRFKKLVEYLLSCYDPWIKRVTLLDNCKKRIKFFENCM